MKRFKNSLVVIALLSSLMAFSQTPKNKIKSLKVAFLTEKLSLSTEEAQAFWPVYNAYETEMQEVRLKERRRFTGIMADLRSMNDREAEALLQAYQDLKKDKHELESRFIVDLKKILPARKVILLFQAEEAFKRRLLKQYRENRRNR